jgi:DNA-binding MarR family transcriptional regulator
MKEKDEKIRREVLKWLYNGFEENPSAKWNGTALPDDLDQFDETDIEYVVSRMDGELVDTEATTSSPMHTIDLRPQGIEELHQEGFDTLLDDDVRYEILAVLYQASRDEPRKPFVSREDLMDEVGVDEKKVDQNIWYLKEKRLVERQGGLGGGLFSRVKITEYGSEKYEAYQEDGIEIPSSLGLTSIRQASIGPGESGKAKNLLRDFVELADDEVIVIDRYARKPLYDLLGHVPSGVDVQVVTIERVVNNVYEQRVRKFQNNHSDVEVRYLDDSDWDFHDRYVIRDREDGWAWGHSFHDAGDTQHTASELKPVNRDRIIREFQKAWQKGQVIV